MSMGFSSLFVYHGEGYIATVTTPDGNVQYTDATLAGLMQKIVQAYPDTKPRQKIVTPGPGFCDPCGHPEDWHDDQGCRFMLQNNLRQAPADMTCRCAVYRSSSRQFEVDIAPASALPMGSFSE